MSGATRPAGTGPTRARSRERWFYLLAAPWLIGLLALQALPVGGAALMSLFNWQPPLQPEWVGLGNFGTLLTDQRFLRAFLNTVAYTAGTVVPGLLLGLGLALLLRGVRRGAGALQATVFLPVVLSGVATALMWGFVFNPRFGLVNGVLGTFGIDGPAWLTDPAWALPSLMAIGLWGLGVNVVVYLAALSGVPRDLEEAAALDGAGRWASFRSITWPALTPITFYLAIVNAIGAFQVFTPTYVLTSGGPADASLTTSLYTYQVAFDSGRLGYAAAISLVVFLAVVVVTIALFRTIGQRVHYLAADS